MTDSTTNTDQQMQVYYDGSCPLCRKEIAWYERRGIEAAMCDVSEATNVPGDLTPEAAMARFHVRDTDGRLLSGAEAFVATWRVTPGLKWLAVLCRPKPVIWVLERLYRLFLRIRPQIQRLAR